MLGTIHCFLYYYYKSRVKCAYTISLQYEFKPATAADLKQVTSIIFQKQKVTVKQ